MNQTQEGILIQLEVHSVDALLDRDGSPLVCPRIHPDVAHEIRAKAKTSLKPADYRISITVPPEDLDRREEVEKAVNKHFENEARDAEHEVRLIGYQGRRSFMIAFLVVGAVLILSEAILQIGSGRFITILSESLIIVAWVILWGPAETLLLARIPVRKQGDTAKALAASPVVLMPKS